MALILRKEGIFTTTQGLGLFGMQRFGVNPRGAMDAFAARTANLLVGNPETDYVIEAHFPAPEIEFTEDLGFAITGADLAATLDDMPLANWSLNVAAAGQLLRFRSIVKGARAYVAIEGGLEPTFQEARTYSTRRLSRGVLLRRLRSEKGIRPRSRLFLSKDILPPYCRSPRVRVIEGAEFGSLEDKSIELFKVSGFTVTKESDRMGFRLSGPPLKAVSDYEMLSAAVTFGTVQLLPDGQVIVLMADHQTSGGYPRIANVITADLPLLAQLLPGDTVSFEPVSIKIAEAELQRVEAVLARLRVALAARM